MFRVAIAYGAIAWLLIEIASVVVPELMLPEWFTRGIIVVLFLGLPVALVLAWAFDVTPGGVRRTPTRGKKTKAAPPEPAKSHPGFIGFVAGILVTAAALYFWQRFEAPTVDVSTELLPQLDQLIAEGSYAEAYELAVQAEPDLDDPTALDAYWPRIADVLTVTTQPPGATVTARMAAPDGTPRGTDSPEPIGTTPVEALRLPRATWLLAIEQDGYAPVERLASSEFGRAQGISTDPANITIHAELVPENEAPARMVFVPGGNYELTTPDLPTGMSAQLDAYFIDRYEVTNDEFTEFVQGGGYGIRTLWPDPVTVNGEILQFESAMTSLVDRTGLNAPRGWSGQAPPANRGDHPVTGVTWYEAVAYCAFRDKQLPTVFQWEKAARDGPTAHGEGRVMPWGYTGPNEATPGRANFNAPGTVPVDAHPWGISPYGAYAMAGNVKEWMVNPIGSGRSVSGGSWEDPVYVFSEFGSFDPMLASRTIGFRCARVRADDAGRFRDQGSFAIEMDERTPVYEPVNEATFRNLLTHYRYDKRPADAEIIDTVETPHWFREKISFQGPGKERVLAYSWLPKSVDPPFQTIVFVPSSSVFSGEAVYDAAEHLLGPLVQSGRAMFAVVMKGMTEREWGPGYQRPARDSVRFREQMIRRATELRLGLDYLETRDDIDTGRLGYVGLSWGAGSRLGFAAMDDRYKAVVFIGGGIDERANGQLPETNNINFAPYIYPPKLLLNGRHDEEHPWYTRALPLWNLLREPKELVLVDGAGHLPPLDVRIPAINTFLDKHLGPPAR